MGLLKLLKLHMWLIFMHHQKLLLGNNAAQEKLKMKITNIGSGILWVLYDTGNWKTKFLKK